MTTKQRLDLLKKSSRKNESSIARYIGAMTSKEPITRRDDPRYRFQIAKNNVISTMKGAIPDGVAMVIGMLGVLMLPAMVMMFM